ncbi:hypothetical protein [Rubricoccus marinus]|uniref:Uncharacterized protein n=1 Tax=Rubricoccus marinus TaxID=716817 RepID=A0A259U269_9BACT|nr:hypothetical protein [Rubricoccus marinus]OZC04050.1 hypothetical protein BSZ36_14285 [Rubricoccus marinus]
MTQPSRPTNRLWRRSRRVLAALALVPLLALTACLPGSGRQNTRALAPADSAAAGLASAVPVDSLVEVWSLPMGEVAEVPSNIAWIQPDSASGARLAVVETKNGAVHTVSASGERGPVWSVGEERYPYLAGVVGDTVVVLSRGVPALEWVTASGVARSVPVPEGATAAFVDRTRTIVRVGGGPSEVSPALVSLSASGDETGRFTFAQPWRAWGFVRPWGDSVLALSGYRPVADVLTPEASGAGALDTLAFAGFDSPQLVRSYQFMTGEVDEPPLLSPAAAALGERLYVLNVRSERVRIDVYDRRGQLVRVLQGAVPLSAEGKQQVLDVYPADLAVRQTASGAVEIALLMKRDRGLFQRADARVLLYRWAPQPLEASGVTNRDSSEVSAVR